MLGAITGDIMGSRFEGMRCVPENFESFHPSCRATDDSILTVAIAHALMDNLDIGETLKIYCRRYPNAGFGGGFLKWVFEGGRGNSWGNGAVMRVSPVGWYSRNIDEVKLLAQAQAMTSHGNPTAITASEIIASSIYLFRTGSTKEQVVRYLFDNYKYGIKELKVPLDYSDYTAIGTTGNCLSVIMATNNFEEAVRQAIALGADTDTNGAVTGSLAEALYGMDATTITKAKSYLDKDLLEVVERFIDRTKNANHHLG